MGPRFLVRTAGLEMHPIDQGDRRRYLKDVGGVGYCNITKCCTEVCPEHIKITDNSIIPLKERVADEFYDPMMWAWRKLRGRRRRPEVRPAADAPERRARPPRRPSRRLPARRPRADGGRGDRRADGRESPPAADDPMRRRPSRGREADATARPKRRTTPLRRGRRDALRELIAARPVREPPLTLGFDDEPEPDDDPTSPHVATREARLAPATASSRRLRRPDRRRGPRQSRSRVGRRGPALRWPAPTRTTRARRRTPRSPTTSASRPTTSPSTRPSSARSRSGWSSARGAWSSCWTRSSSSSSSPAAGASRTRSCGRSGPRRSACSARCPTAGPRPTSRAPRTPSPTRCATRPSTGSWPAARRSSVVRTRSRSVRGACGRLRGGQRGRPDGRASTGQPVGVRKVRAPQREVAGNSRPPRGEDQRHSDDAGRREPGRSETRQALPGARPNRRATNPACREGARCPALGSAA